MELATRDKHIVFQSPSSSKEFLLSKAELRPWRKILKKKEDGKKDVLNKLFPGMQSGENFMEQAMKTLSSYLAFSSMAVRIDNMNESDSLKPEDVEKALGDAAKAVDDICKAGNGFWGRSDRFLFTCYFPDKNASSCMKLALKLKKSLENMGETTVTTGVAAYPAFGYRKQDIMINAGKALDHADYFGSGSIVVFDAVSLNISGDKLYHEGDIEGAIKEYKTALLFDPDNVNVHNSLGVCYGILEDFQKALKEFKECIRLSPKEAMPLYNAGLVSQLTGKKEKALKYFEKSGKLGGELFEIDFQTGKLLLEMGKHQEGREYIEKALKLKPESSVALFYLGESFVAAGMTDDAEAAYEKAIKINPNDAASLSALGWLYEDKGKNRDVALAFCRQSTEIDPDNGLFRLRLGRLYIKRGLGEDAAKEFKKARKLGCDTGDSMDMKETGKEKK
jgi:tetratricopeptide (TPR) repeat protein